MRHWKNRQNLFGCGSRLCRAVPIFLVICVLLWIVYPSSDATLSPPVQRSCTSRSHDAVTTFPYQSTNLSDAYAAFYTQYFDFLYSYCITNYEKRKLLIYRCRRSIFGNHYCGGLGDRMRGIISGFYVSLMTGRCFGIDWEPVSDITAFFQVPVPSFSEMKGRREYTVAPELGGSDALLRKIGEVREFDLWEENDIVYYMSNEISWEKTTHMPEFLASDFSALSQLNSYEQAHLVMRLFFSDRTHLLSHEFKDPFSQFCETDAVIGVQMRLSEGRYEMNRNDMVGKCFVPEMARRCVEFLKRNQKKACAYFVTTDLSHSEMDSLLHELRGKLDDSFATLFPSENIQYNLFSSPVASSHIDQFSLLYTLFGISNIRDYLGTFLDWEILKSVDVLIISRSGYPQSAYWFSGAPAFVLNTYGNGCTFLPATKEAAFSVNTSKN